MRGKIIQVLCLVGFSIPHALAMQPAPPGPPSPMEDLNAFRDNSRAFMDRIPTKIRANSAATPIEFPERKFHRRRHPFLNPGFLSRIERNDQPEDLLDRVDYRRLEEIEADGLRSGEVAVTPWSDDYWGYYSEVLAKRYADPAYPVTFDWKKSSDYLLATLGKRKPSMLSPAEKYDLLTGASGWTMTRAMIDAGRHFYEETGLVENWIGICHGWAAAALRFPRPLHDVVVPSLDGKLRLVFHPADIKGLASALWGFTKYGYRMIGGRCEQKDPATDEAGRILDPDCSDTNPATFHLTLVNQVGQARKSFIMDASLDLEVWNQPVQSYTYGYFNPQTLKVAATLAEATVLKSEFRKDRFSSYRSPDAISMTGIILDLVYVTETYPTAVSSDGPKSDKLEKVRYYYDLELDRSGKIIGGEWYVNRHPDFLWLPPSETQPLSWGDEALNQRGDDQSWGLTGPIPNSWSNVIPETSALMQPLNRVVTELLRRSRE